MKLETVFEMIGNQRGHLIVGAFHGSLLLFFSKGIEQHVSFFCLEQIFFFVS